jgi:hypothetical protein
MFEITIRGHGSAPPDLASQIRAICQAQGLRAQISASYPALNDLLSQAEQRLERADAAGDEDAFGAHYMVWLSLFSLKHRLPWSN